MGFLAGIPMEQTCMRNLSLLRLVGVLSGSTPDHQPSPSEPVADMRVGKMMTEVCQEA